MADRIPIECRDLTFSYAAHLEPALRNCSLRIDGGTCAAVLGPTGAGKTTLLYALAGLLGAHSHAEKTTGEITIGSTRHTPLPGQIQFPTIGMLLQEPHLQLSGMAETVFEEVAWTLENLGVELSELTERVQHTLLTLGVQHLRDRRLRSLSGGEVHRVALASVLVADPSVILLDEPFSALDQIARESVVRILRSLRGSRTILLTDTDPDAALRVAETIIILDKGSVLFVGSPGAFLDRLDEFASLLPLTDWIQARDAVRSLPAGSSVRRRIGRLVEGL